MRYYYKTADGKSISILESHLESSDYIEITEEEFNELFKSKRTYRRTKGEEEKQIRIEQLKAQLAALDYIGVKIATGRATREEYADKIALMQEYADEINRLQGGGDNE